MHNMVKMELLTNGDMKKARESNRGVIVTNSPKSVTRKRSRIHHPSCRMLKLVFEEWGELEPDRTLVRDNIQTYHHFGSVETVDIDHAKPCCICKTKPTKQLSKTPNIGKKQLHTRDDLKKAFTAQQGFIIINDPKYPDKYKNRIHYAKCFIIKNAFGALNTVQSDVKHDNGEGKTYYLSRSLKDVYLEHAAPCIYCKPALDIIFNL